jgi:hypothetical protein
MLHIQNRKTNCFIEATLSIFGLASLHKAIDWTETTPVPKRVLVLRIPYI